MSKKLISIIAACLCALVLTFGGVKPAHSEPSAVISVTTLEDIISESDRHCSLREAINAANLGADADTISFSVSGTITLGTTLAEVTDTAGLTISAQHGLVMVSVMGSLNPV